jgi:(p)ppGpp synthase/HD superfamily hydrolase
VCTPTDDDSKELKQKQESLQMKYSQRINKAIRVATYLHRNQTRRGTDIPYIAHPFAVFLILCEYTDDEDVLIAGLLHDVLEDADPREYDADKLRNDFGGQILQIVQNVSEQKNGDISKGDAKSSWKARKEAYLDHLRSVGEESLWVSTADKIHNLSSTIEDLKMDGGVVWTKFNAPKAEQLWFYGEFCSIVKSRTKNPIVQKLDSLFQEVENL